MEIRLPGLGEDAESGTVAAIFVKVGDTVERDQSLIELESEKAVASIPSPAAGRVTRIHVTVGDEIRTGSLLATLDEEVKAAGPDAPPESAPDAAPVDLPPAAGEAAEVPSPPTGPRIGPVATKPGSPPHPEQSRPLKAGVAPAASPSIRRMARDLGIDLREVRGTARGGRIVLGDLRDYISRLRSRSSAQSPGPPEGGSAPPPSPIDFSRWGPVETLRASAIRKTIAARMLDSWTRIPHVTQFADADITRLHGLRKQHGPRFAEKGARLTLTPVLLRALARALRRHPLLNSSMDDESGNIVIKQYYHLGLAVDTDAGLIVPVIRDADRKSLFELAREVEDIGERARQRKATRDDLQGGTFTVSNQGGIGGTYFTPIINYPEVAVLGIGRGRDVVRMSEGEAEPRLLLPLALSHDHRVVDGADGVRFLTDLIGELEEFPESEFDPS